ncbi:MAG: NUDIX domain-containing protein [Pseudomonadota bacterium]
MTTAIPAKLGLGDAVAAIICVHDGRYLLQQRDDIEGIWYPGHWGCFGGGVDAGETPAEALERELREELDLVATDAVPACSLDFDLADLGKRQYFRRYYEVKIHADVLDSLVLGEGTAVAAFSPDYMFRELKLTPYDSFALYLHHNRAVLR